MIEVPIPKDIRAYETKLVGMFTARQTVFFVLSCIAGYGGFMLEKYIWGINHLNGIFIFTAMVPFIAFGWVKPFGLSLEVFLRTAFICNYLSPKNRKYKVNNLHEKLRIATLKMETGENPVLDEEQDSKKKKKKKEQTVKLKKEKLPPELKPYR